MAELFWLLRLSLSLALILLFQGGEDKPGVGNVDFNNPNALKLFGFSQNVLEGNVFTVDFSVDYILKLDFSI